MALNKPVVTEQSKAVTSVEDTVDLELALYTNYNVGGQMYVKGTAYRFTKSSALTLLSERDCGRPVWKIHQKPQAKVKAEQGPVDATKVVVKSVEPVPGTPEYPKTRIDIGTDAEIADIIGGAKESEGDVTL